MTYLLYSAAKELVFGARAHVGLDSDGSGMAVHGDINQSIGSARANLEELSQRENSGDLPQGTSHLGHNLPAQYSCAGEKLIAWYTQIPGNRLSMLMCPHRGQAAYGLDMSAALQSKCIITTLLTMRYIQVALFLLGIWWVGLGLLAMPEGIQATQSAHAHCANIRINMRPTRQVDPHPFSGHVDFGLLLSGCKVNGGKQHIVDDMHAHEISFPEPVEFDGFFFRSLPETVDLGHDISFIVECLDEVSTGRRVLAASGKCGWFAGISNANDIQITDPLPGSQLTRYRNHHVKFDYSHFECRLPLLLSACATLISGMTMLLTVVHAKYFTGDGAFGIDTPNATLSVGFSVSRICCAMIQLMAWRPNVPMALSYACLGMFFLSLLASQEFLEERIISLGLLQLVLSIVAAGEPGNLSLIPTAFSPRPFSLAGTIGLDRIPTSHRLVIDACSTLLFALTLLAARIYCAAHPSPRLLLAKDQSRAALHNIAEQDKMSMRQVCALASKLHADAQTERSRARSSQPADANSTFIARTVRWLAQVCTRGIYRVMTDLTPRHRIILDRMPRHLALTNNQEVPAPSESSAEHRRASYHLAAASTNVAKVPEVACLDQVPSF